MIYSLLEVEASFIINVKMTSVAFPLWWTWIMTDDFCKSDFKPSISRSSSLVDDDWLYKMLSLYQALYTLCTNILGLALCTSKLLVIFRLHWSLSHFFHIVTIVLYPKQAPFLHILHPHPLTPRQQNMDLKEAFHFMGSYLKYKEF